MVSKGCTLKARYPCHRQARPLQVPGARSAPWTPITWSCAQEKCAPASASAISRWNRKKPAPSTPLTTSASTATNPIFIPIDRVQKPSSKQLSNSWPATATSKRHGPHGPHRTQAFRSSLAPPSASLDTNSPIPPSSSMANWKTRQAPGTSFEPYPIPVLGDPKKLVQALDQLRSLKSFPSPKAVNTTTGPQLPKYVSAAFGSLDLPRKLGPLALRLRRHLLPPL
jgi:hypothetical protein